MKKWGVFFICVMVFVQLCACSEMGVGEKEPQAVRENVYIVSINPQALIRENADTGEILSVSMLNEDAEEYYKNMEVKGKKLSEVVEEMVQMCVDKGLLNEDNTDVNIVVTQYMNEDETLYEEELGKIRQSMQEKYQDTYVLVDSKAENYQKPEGEGEGEATQETETEIWVECPNCVGGRLECPFCHGDWEHGEYTDVEVDCENCENGSVMHKRQTFVYNGTPCKICNDVGTVDDGMHGGERAECGECRGYGAAHSVGDYEDDWYFNGDYRSYAFDEVEEEYGENCPVCGGEGFFEEHVQEPCARCNRGEIVCSTCEEHGGWMIPVP